MKMGRREMLIVVARIHTDVGAPLYCTSAKGATNRTINSPCAASDELKGADEREWINTPLSMGSLWSTTRQEWKFSEHPRERERWEKRKKDGKFAIFWMLRKRESNQKVFFVYSRLAFHIVWMEAEILQCLGWGTHQKLESLKEFDVSVMRMEFGPLSWVVGGQQWPINLALLWYELERGKEQWAEAEAENERIFQTWAPFLWLKIHSLCV